MASSPYFSRNLILSCSASISPNPSISANGETSGGGTGT